MRRVIVNNKNRRIIIKHQKWAITCDLVLISFSSNEGSGKFGHMHRRVRAFDPCMHREGQLSIIKGMNMRCLCIRGSSNKE